MRNLEVKEHYRRWLPTDVDAFFNFGFLALFKKKFVVCFLKTRLFIQVYKNASKRKDGE